MNTASQSTIPVQGQIVRVRSRTWLVEEVENDPGYGSTVHLACLDDDAQGDLLSIDWELELDARIISEESWRGIGRKGFDPPKVFASYLNTLRWNYVTATNPDLFQSPFRSGIRHDRSELDPQQGRLGEARGDFSRPII